MRAGKIFGLWFLNLINLLFFQRYYDRDGYGSQGYGNRGYSSSGYDALGYSPSRGYSQGYDTTGYYSPSYGTSRGGYEDRNWYYQPEDRYRNPTYDNR